MAGTTVFRTTKIGNGFIKEDVMQYLDELNSKISNLEAENERLKKGSKSVSERSESPKKDAHSEVVEKLSCILKENQRTNELLEHIYYHMSER